VDTLSDLRAVRGQRGRRGTAQGEQFIQGGVDLPTISTLPPCRSHSAEPVLSALSVLPINKIVQQAATPAPDGQRKAQALHHRHAAHSQERLEPTAGAVALEEQTSLDGSVRPINVSKMKNVGFVASRTLGEYRQLLTIRVFELRRQAGISELIERDRLTAATRWGGRWSRQISVLASRNPRLGSSSWNACVGE
jgi:hypothetical protein